MSRREPDVQTVSTSLAPEVSPTADTVLDRAAGPSSAGDRAEQRIGRYTIRRKLGEGGMGVVYAAHDPELAREVALKVLRTESARVDRLERRLQREARALARLAHDNVVRVFDVGSHDGQVFLAMELVDGITVADWLVAAPRDWHEVVDVYRAAGRGLAEAHAAGIVHRDFKPGNVMIDRKGRVVVTDFGLARADNSAEVLAAGSTEDSDDDRLTRDGALVGTPRYMAPEQLMRLDATAASDQFAFALALFEGVAKTRAFAGHAPDELLAAMRTGRIAPARMPAWLRRVLVRALAAAPHRRFPNMAALLAALARGRRRRTRFVIAGSALGVVAASVTATFMLGSREAAAPCERAADRVAAAWTPAQRARIAEQLPALRPAFGALAAQRVTAKLDAYAAQLAAQRVDACRATVEAAPAARIYEPQCLDDQLRSLTKVAHALADAPTPELVDHADDALAQLADCDRRAIAQVAPPPAALEPAVSALRDELADTDLIAARGDYAVALAAVRPLVERARGLGYAPVLGEALARAGELGHQLEDASAQAALREAAEVASGAHDDHTAMKAWTGLLTAAALEPDHPDSFEATFTAARAAAARTGDPEDRATLDLVHGEALNQAGKSHDGEASCQRAVDEFAKLHGAQSLEVRRALRCLGDARQEHGDYPGSREALERALAIDRAIVGADHPLTAADEQVLGELQLRTGNFKDGIATVEHALAIRERVFGKTADVIAITEHTLGNLLVDAGHPTEAMPHLERSLAIATANHGPESVMTAPAYSALGTAYMDLERRADARPLLEHAIAIYTKAGKTNDVGIVSINLADLLIDDKKWDEALPVSRRALAALEQSLGKDSPIVGFGLYDTARCLNATGKPADAIPLLERALALNDPATTDPNTIAIFKMALAESLWATGGDGTRATRLIEEAIAALKAIGDTAGTPQALAHAQALLRAHHAH